MAEINIDVLRLAGLDDQTILRVLEAAVAMEDGLKRTQGRARQSRYRGRAGAQPRVKPPKVLRPPPPVERAPPPDTVRYADERNDATYQSAKTTIDNFSLPDEGYLFAARLGHDGAWIEREFQRMVDNARSRKLTSADWLANWRSWCTSPYQVNGQGNGHDKPSHAAWRASRDKLAAYAERLDAEERIRSAGGSPPGPVPTQGRR